MKRAHLGNRTALVTGGAAGIGWATAQLLARRGARVMVADLDGVRAAERAASLGPEHISFGLDVSRRESVEAMFAAFMEKFGGIDILVNNAGRTDSRGLPMLEHDDASFAAVLDVNLNGTIYAARRAAELMSDGGSIVNLASGAAFRALPLRGSYSASKAGVVAFTRALATEVGTRIRVNAVAPGFTVTELVSKLVAEGRLDLTQAASKVPIGRVAQPEELAEAICYLASPGAAHVHGTTLVVDGGSEAFGGSRPPAEALVQKGAPEGGLHVVIGDVMAENCAALLRAEGLSVVVIADGSDLPAQLRSHAQGEGLASVLDVRALPRDGTAVSLLRAQFAVAQAAGEILCAQGGGAYACFIDGDALSSTGEAAAYRESAAMLVKTLACEWAASGVRANAAVGSAGPAATELLAFFASQEASYCVGATAEI